MSTNGFKPKTAKKIKVGKNANVTLDSKHNEFVEAFDKDEQEKIPALQQEKNELYSKLNNDKMILEEQLRIKDRIGEINEEIKQLRIRKKNYYLSNSKHVFDYFESKKNISNMDASTSSSKNNKIGNFFKLNNDTEYETNNSNNIVKTYLSGIDHNFIDVNSFVKPTHACFPHTQSTTRQIILQHNTTRRRYQAASAALGDAP